VGLAFTQPSQASSETVKTAGAQSKDAAHDSTGSILLREIIVLYLVIAPTPTGGETKLNNLEDRSIQCKNNCPGSLSRRGAE
jgi:hypothetical protein